VKLDLTYIGAELSSSLSGASSLLAHDNRVEWRICEIEIGKKKEIADNFCLIVSTAPQMPRRLTSQKPLARVMASADDFYLEYIYNLRIGNKWCLILISSLWNVNLYYLCFFMSTKEKSLVLRDLSN
jgi:hypothetical protein